MNRHDVLADPTRQALLDALRGADAPLDVQTLAAGVGLRPNSVREQLRHLEAAGMVRVSVAPAAGRGRPGFRYRISPTGAEAGDPWKLLGTSLADELLDRPEAATILSAAGERWGRTAVTGVSAVTVHGGRNRAPGGTPVETIAAVMTEAGFAADHPQPGDREIRLRACPFLPLERRHLPLVCGMHLGFVRGALRELGSPVDAVSIEPFVRPDLCVAHLGSPAHD